MKAIILLVMLIISGLVIFEVYSMFKEQEATLKKLNRIQLKEELNSLNDLLTDTLVSDLRCIYKPYKSLVKDCCKRAGITDKQTIYSIILYFIAEDLQVTKEDIEKCLDEVK